jgi:hypothetical protein
MTSWSSMEANAALRAIVRRDSGEGYREMLKRLAVESGIATPTAEDLIRLDRKRKGKRLSNQDWTSPVDPEAKIAKLKDGRTRLAYKPEHAVDLDTGAIVAAEIHPANQGDTTTLPETLKAAESNLAAVDAGPTVEEPAELVADKRQFPHQSKVGLTARTDIPIPTSGPWPQEGNRVGFEDLRPDRDGDRALRGAERAQARASASRDSAGAGDAAPVWARGHALAQPEGDTEGGQRLDPASPARGLGRDQPAAAGPRLAGGHAAW